MNLRFKNHLYFLLICISIWANALLFAEEWTIQESFENNDFNGVTDLSAWVQGGDAPWTIDATYASDGIYSARSGVITDNQVSSITTSVDIPYLPGSVQFSYKISTESNYDKLKFYVNGSEKVIGDGLYDWADTTFVLTPGSYTFKWEYYKDGSVSNNDDAVWIDNIRIIGHNIVVNAGNDSNLNFIHDAAPGGEVQLDGSNTYPDENANLSIPALAAWFQNQMKWYSINDMDNILATGVNPSISLDCSMSDDIIDMCVGEHDIVLKIAFGTFEQLDTVNITIKEPNQNPILTATSVVDTGDIANNNGIPGNSTSVNLTSQYFDQVQFSDPDIQSDGTEDPLSLSWTDIDGNILSPLQTVTAGDYTYILIATDPYGSSANITLSLSMTEVNETPIVTIAAVNNLEIGLDQNSLENQVIPIYGFVEDEDNDLDGSTITTDDDVNYLWVCTQNGNPITVANETSVNASFTSPIIGSNLETETVICSLQAIDPFQVISGTNSLSESVSITVYNDNQAPVIDISAVVKPSLNEDSSYILDLDILTTSFITVTDVDNDLNFNLEIDIGDNYTLDNSTITPSSDFYGILTIPIRVSDGIIYSEELYNNLSETVDLIIDVIGVNDPPILVAPANSSAQEDTDISITGVSVSDVDIDGIINNERLQYDISVVNGTVSLNQTNGFLFEASCDCDGINDEILSFTANPQNFNNGVSTLTFHPLPDYFGPDGEISISVNDEGNIGIPDGADPTELTDLQIISISVSAINDPPIFTVPVSTDVDEDNQILVTGFSVDDIDIADYVLEVQFSVENGVVSISETENIIFDYGDGIEDEQVSFSGTKTAVNNLLNSITFIPNEHFNGNVIFSATVDDLGAYGGGSLTDNKTFTINVNSINDPPEGVDDSFSVAENEALIDNVLTNDIDLDELNGSSPASHFSLTINTTPVENVVNGSLSLTSDGSFTYQPFTNYNGEDGFVYELLDGAGGIDSVTVSIVTSPINNAPELTLPSSRTALEDTQLEISGIAISDEDVAENSLEVQLSVDSGLITLSSMIGLTFNSGDGDSDALLIFSGSITDISSAISTLTFIPEEHFNGDVQLQVDVDDLGGTGAGGPLTVAGNLLITVNPDNDNPTAVEDTGTILEDTVLTSNVLTNDSDLDSSNGSSPDNHFALTVNVIPVTNVQNGILTLASDGSYTYDPFDNYFGSDSFVYELSDGAGGSAQATVSLTINGVNDAPILNIPTDKFTDEDTEIIISNISVSDVDVAVNDLEIKISVDTGLITLGSTTGLTFSLGDGNSDASLIFSGLITDISSAISPLIFIPDEHFNGDVQLQVDADDLGGTGSGGPLTVTGNLLITVNAVNDDPTAAGDDISVDEDSVLTSNVLTNDTDLDSSNGSSPDNHFSLTVNPFPITDVTNGVLIISNDGSYTYTPLDDYFGIDSFVYELLDGAGGGSQATVNITVNAVNDPPELDVPTDKYTDEDTPISIDGIIFNDIDIADSEMKMDINVLNSFVSLGQIDGLTFISGDGMEDSQLSFTGNKTNILNATSTITFIPEENYNGVVAVEVSISDIGGNGSGGTLFDTDEFLVTISSVNDLPVVNSPGGQSDDEDNEFSIYGLSVSDIDAIESTNEVEITISADSGQLSLFTVSDLTFLTGDGTLDPEIKFVGLIPDINTALNGFSFLGNSDYNGKDTIIVQINDLGNTGTGDISPQQVKMAVYLNAVNDPPVNQLNNGEDAPPQISVVGTEITAVPGSWNDKIDTDISLTAANIIFSYQWQRNSINCTDGFYYNECNDAAGIFLVGSTCGASDECQLLEENWIDILEENLETYEIINVDAQKYIRIEVTATDDGVGLPSQQSTIAFSDFHYVDNSAPIPQNIGYNMYEDNVLNEDAPGILLNDSDPDDDVISSEVVTYPENGEVNLSLNGSFEYTPDQNFNGVDQFEYKISDGALYGNDNAIVSITVSPVNDIPIFTSGGNVESSENLGNVDIFGWASDISDGDPEAGQALEFILTALNPDLFEVQPTVDPVSGTLSFAVYDNLNGNSDITISLKDNGGLDNEGVDETELIQFNLNIIPINDSPIFTPGNTIIVLEDSGEYSEFSWATDIDDGDAELVQELSFSIISNDNSLLFAVLPTINENGKITFTVADNNSGVAEIIFSLLDDGSSISPNSNSSAESTLIINVTPVNDVPRWTVGEGIEILEDAGSQVIPNYITGVDDGDPEVAQILTFNLIDVTNPALFSETPSIDAMGTLTYLINEDINGSSLVYFTLSDDGGTDEGGVNQTGQQFFEIEVLAVNDPPAFGIDELGELAEDDFSVAEIIVTPVIPPNDEGNQSVQYSLSSFEAINANGVVFANLSIESGTGNVTINPIDNGNGVSQDIIITATDGSGTENEGIETFEQIFVYTVNDINDPPVNIELPSIGGNPYIDSLLTVTDGSWSDSLDTFYSGNSEITYAYRWERSDNNIAPLTNLTNIGDAFFNEYDVTQSDYHKFLRVKIIATDNGPGDIGLDSFVYTDFIEILNTPPIAVDDSYSMNEDLILEIGFETGLLLGWTQGDECVRHNGEYATDCDRDGDLLVTSIASSVLFGELTLNEDGSFIYIPDTNRNNINMNITDNVSIDEFTYTVSDGESSSLPARVSIVVNPVNDAPIFELTNSNNEVINSVDVLEDFTTQQVLITQGLIPNDETGQEVVYTISPESITSADISINSETGEVTIQSLADLYSITEFTITAIDDGGIALDGVDSYTQNFTLNITSVNDMPSFLKGEDQSILEDEGEIFISWATDISRGPVDEIPQELTFNITTDNDGLFERYPIVNGNTGELSYKIADNLNGEVQISLSLKDNGGIKFGGVDESGVQTFNISIQAVNDAPSFALGSNIDLELDEDGIGKSVESWVSDISKGPIDEVSQILSFNITSSKSDSTIFIQFPEINEVSGKIEYSITPDYNGLAEFTINLSDDGGKEYGGQDTSVDTTFSIWVHQVNDIPKPFEIHPRVFDYAKDNSTFYYDVNENSDTTNIFYRLPYQVFAPPLQPDSLLRFSWVEDDSLDVDTYATWNFDSLFRLYYRLEATPGNNSKTYVLSDDIDSRFFTELDSVSVDIDMTSKFPVYTGEFDPDSIYTTEHLDTTGVTEYSWTVLAQNYIKDRLDADPVRSVISDIDLKIDLELPSAEMAFFQSELYSEYYDLYFLTNEETIDSVARVWIDFDTYTQNLFPGKMGDSLYHISSTFVSTGTVKYNFQVRDKRLNLGRSLDTVNYEILIPDLARTVLSPDHIFKLYVPQNSVAYETPVIISASNVDEGLPRNSKEIISREYQIAANSMVLLKPVMISFTLSKDFTEEPSYKYQIIRINDNTIEELSTEFDGESFLTSIMSSGNYAVVYNSDYIEPLPEKFALGNIYPNPFNPSTTIEFAIPDENMVMIDIYNLRGQHVLNLMDKNINPGYHAVIWSGLDEFDRIVPSGIYFVKIKFTNQLISKKVTFLK